MASFTSDNINDLNKRAAKRYTFGEYAEFFIDVDYTVPAVVVGTDDKIYESLVTPNIGNDPVTDGGVNWGEITDHLHANQAVLDATTASYTTAEETKLAGIETAATADQTDAEIKTAYELNANTNEFSDAEQTKLAGIETSAKDDQSAAEVVYSNTTSGLTATDVQAAIDEVDGTLDGVPATVLDAKAGRKNLFHNGRGRVQQVVDGTLSTSFVFGGDRWEAQADGTVGAGTITTVTTATAGNTGAAHKLSGVTLTGAGKVRIRSRYESKDAIEFKGGELIVSASVFHDVGSNKNYKITVNKATALNDFTSVTEIGASSAISVATSTDTAIEFAIADLGDVTNGIEVIIEVDCGAVTTKNFEFTDLQGEKDSVVTAFEYRSTAEELFLCQRQYQTGFVSITDTGAINAITYFEYAEFTQPMLSIPSVVLSGGSNIAGNGASVSTVSVTSSGFNITFSTSTVLDRVTNKTWTADARL